MKKRLQFVSAVILAGSVTAPIAAQVKTDTVKESRLEEVVVTALGIKRQDIALGYVAETVGAKILRKHKTTTGRRLWKKWS